MAASAALFSRGWARAEGGERESGFPPDIERFAADTAITPTKNPDPDSCTGAGGFRRVVSTSHFFVFKSAPLKVLTMAAMSPSWGGGPPLASRLCCLFVTPDEQVAQRVQSMLTPAYPRQKLSTLERVTISPQLGRPQTSGRLFICANHHRMATTYFYRCPNTGQTVQGWFADEVGDNDVYDLVKCLACALPS